MVKAGAFSIAKGHRRSFCPSIRTQANQVDFYSGARRIPWQWAAHIGGQGRVRDYLRKDIERNTMKGTLCTLSRRSSPVDCDGREPWVPPRLLRTESQVRLTEACFLSPYRTITEATSRRTPPWPKPSFSQNPFPSGEPGRDRHFAEAESPVRLSSAE
jgi:hypothetical protein